MARGHWRLAPGLELSPGSSQLLQGDLNLAIKLPHVQQEGDMVAVMLNDVVVHVDQDAGREERWLDWGRPLALVTRMTVMVTTYQDPPKTSSIPHFLSDPHNCKVVVPCPTFRGGHNARVAEPQLKPGLAVTMPPTVPGASLNTYERGHF